MGVTETLATARTPGPALERARRALGRDSRPACWMLDISAARPVLAAIRAGSPPTDWVSAVLAAVRVIEADARATHLLGPYGDDGGMVGRAIDDFWPPESRAVLAELILATASAPSPTPHTRAATSLVFPDPTLRAWTAEDGSQPETVFLSVTGEMIDDRSLWAVRASEARYRKLLDHLPIALLQLDARGIDPIYDGLRAAGVRDLPRYFEEHPELLETVAAKIMVTEVNAQAVTLFGAGAAADLLGPAHAVFAAAPEAARRVLAARYEGQRRHAETTTMRSFDNRLLDVAITVTFPQLPARRDATVVTIEDVTETLRTEMQLRQIQSDYSRAARISLLGELAASIAHEVNQPLSAIVTNAETSLRWLSRDEPNLAKVGQLTYRIADSARQASDIVQRIRAMTARRSAVHTLLNLNDVVEEALAFVRHEIAFKVIDLVVQRDPHLPHVLGDRVQLQQVMVNLLVNAVQAQSGSPHDRIVITTDVRGDGAPVFSIHDAGPGIATATRERIFDSFFTTKADGTGIGLAICQSIVTAHGGSIDAFNHPAGGAVFRFTLPAAAR